MHRKGSKLSLIIFISIMMFMIGFAGGLSHLPNQWLINLLPDSGGEYILAWYLPGEKTNTMPWLSWCKNILEPKAIFSKAGVPAAFAMAVTAEPETSLPYPDEEYIDPENKGGEIKDKETEKDSVENIKDEPVVAIYCSHNAECYAATSGVDRLEGKNGGVYHAAKQLKNKLTELGVPAVLCDTIHDYPDWALSYQNSLQSMQKMKEKYPGLEVFIDIHRDAPLSQGSTIYELKDGRKVARLMLIVGSNNRLKHPDWQKNLAFSKKIGSALEDAYPGIMRGVRVQNGRYNQHFSDKAILVEVGSTENTLTEAKNSADILAEVLAKIIKSNK